MVTGYTVSRVIRAPIFLWPLVTTGMRINPYACGPTMVV